MAKGRPSTASTSRAEEDDSLLVHPATQMGQQPASSGERSSLEDGAEEEESEESEAPAGDSQGFWEAEAILDAAGSMYLIRWKGCDEDGDPWKPTWEPKENANASLVASWERNGLVNKRAEQKRKLEEQAEKKRKVEEEKKAKAARRLAKGQRKPAEKEKGKGKGKERVESVSRASVDSTSTAASTSAPSAQSASVVRDETMDSEEPVQKVFQRKKVVLSDSESSQPLPQPPVAKKQKVEQEKEKKKVAFETIVVDESEEDASQAISVGQEEPVASSGEMSTMNVPDSQAFAVAPASSAAFASAAVVTDGDESQGPNVPVPASSLSQQYRVTQLNSPATSNDGDSDVRIINPRQLGEELSASPEQAQHAPLPRPLGRVPLPTAAAFGIFASGPVSSQVDPIEDPDSSPRRSPSRHHQQPFPAVSSATASPISRFSRPAKNPLVLVTTDEDDTPIELLQLESSYESIAPNIGSTQLRPVGGTPVRPFSQPSGGGIIVKRPQFRPPTPPAEGGISIGGGGVGGAAVARSHRPRSPTPEAEVVEDSFFLDASFGSAPEPSFEHAQQPEPSSYEPDYAAEFMKEYLNGDGEDLYCEEFYDSDGEFDEVRASRVGYGEEEGGMQWTGGRVEDAGEGGSSNGYQANGTAGGQQQGGATGGGAAASSASGHVRSAGYSAAPTESSSSIGGGGSAGGGGGGGGLLPTQLPNGHSQPAAQPTKRELETEEDGEEATKKPRLEDSVPSSAAQPQPASSSQPFQTQPIPSSSQASSYATRPLNGGAPALNIISPTPSQPTQPSSLAAAVAAVPTFVTIAPSSPSSNASSPSKPSIFEPVGSTMPLTRDTSPRPAVEEVVALVRASIHIRDDDGTKAEVEKFLRDMKSYIDDSTASLSRLEFWAFELRRHAVDGVDKVDFIVLDLKEGSYMLKRAVAGKVPVEFAYSLEHSPGPVEPLSMTRDQLLEEVNRLRHLEVDHSVELSKLRPLAAEVLQLRTDVVTLQRTNQQLQNSRDSAQSDMSYMQAQYQAASSAAVERADEARVAEAEASRLRVLLDSGLKQKEMLYVAKDKQRKEELEKLRKEMKFYKEQRRRTDEAKIREKAAKWEEHVASLRREAEEEVQRKRGEEVEEAELDSDEEVEDALLSSSLASSAATTAAFFTAVPNPFPSSSAAFSASGGEDTSGAEPSTLVSSGDVSTFERSLLAAVRGNAVGAGRDEGFRCEWRTWVKKQELKFGQPPVVPCGEVYGTRDELFEHVVKHV